MNVTAFVNKWRKVDLTERAASQEHFLDLCALLGHPTPAEADPEASTFTFERGVRKRGGGDGWADVWKKGFFGWEYKGKHKNLDAAYDQLLQYAEALENPHPLLLRESAHPSACAVQRRRRRRRRRRGSASQLHDWTVVARGSPGAIPTEGGS